MEAAERLGVTLVGFLRGDGFNVYARPERVAAGGRRSAQAAGVATSPWNLARWRQRES